ncbi:MAG TPA: oxygenase MpaB family protein [Mucilaginibacter sp.]|jgi:uncharacterized protein (DUF2236 family)|nr:oxygenase MpaB family protein [Mucilaginibacter sp.]
MDDVFVAKDSIVRQIWGKADTVLFIFAGAAAEFALNKAVDWLYFTGRLPADPLERLFSTVAYARQIIFSKKDEALNAIDQITAIHKNVEKNRGKNIPDWAYLDVLFLLIDYSVRSFELLERKLSTEEKAEVFEVFWRVGNRMQLKDLPGDFNEWLKVREAHLDSNLIRSEFTVDLYRQYKKHLGLIRYSLLLQVQIVLVPVAVKNLLELKKSFWLAPLLNLYKFSRLFAADRLLKEALLPKVYKTRIKALDVV